jgi:hypothetical protein
VKIFEEISLRRRAIRPPTQKITVKSSLDLRGSEYHHFKLVLESLESSLTKPDVGTKIISKKLDIARRVLGEYEDLHFDSTIAEVVMKVNSQDSTELDEMERLMECLDEADRAIREMAEAMEGQAEAKLKMMEQLAKPVKNVSVKKGPIYDFPGQPNLGFH